MTSVGVIQTGQMCCGVDCNTNERWNQYAGAMNAVPRHNALSEAVAWERECEWLNDLITEQYACVSEIAPEEEEISVSYIAARAEVDRLIAEAGVDK